MVATVLQGVQHFHIYHVWDLCRTKYIINKEHFIEDNILKNFRINAFKDTIKILHHLEIPGFQNFQFFTATSTQINRCVFMFFSVINLFIFHCCLDQRHYEYEDASAYCEANEI